MYSAKLRSIFLIYFLGFLFAFHTALPTFINSSFLNTIISEKAIGIFYTIASVLSIILLFFSPTVLRRLGNYRFFLLIIVLEILALLGLIFINNSVLSLVFLLASLIIIPLIYFSLDIFLESFSHDLLTGRIRGIYLTLSNLAWIFVPIIVGFILTNDDYWKIYLGALLFLLPIIIIVYFFRDFRDSEYEKNSIRGTLISAWSNNNIWNILGANFLLNFFYSWMTIYTPLYLHKYCNFSWTEIGFIFSIMLIPFILTQFPLGKLADEKLGEKEILIAGFIIMSVSTCALFFIPNSGNIWLWASLLFITRIGASSVEVMSSAYFFKKVNDSKSNLISCMGISRSLAYIFGPLSLSFFLFFVGNMGGLFLILGFIMLIGVWFGFRIKDTK